MAEDYSLLCNYNPMKGVNFICRKGVNSVDY